MEISLCNRSHLDFEEKYHWWRCANHDWFDFYELEAQEGVSFYP